MMKGVKSHLTDKKKGTKEYQ